jgi:hypothetical protein
VELVTIFVKAAKLRSVPMTRHFAISMPANERVTLGFAVYYKKVSIFCHYRPARARARCADSPIESNLEVIISERRLDDAVWCKKTWALKCPVPPAAEAFAHIALVPTWVRAALVRNTRCGAAITTNLWRQ